MWQPYLLLFLIPSCLAAPTTVHDEPTTDAIEGHYRRDLAVISYIQSFKTLMTDYVRSQYTELTHHELEQITDVIEEFLTSFARDLRNVVDKNEDKISSEDKTERIEEERLYVDDGMADSQFDDIKERIKVEFPEVDDATAQEIVVSLRRNLFATRQKLDNIINSAKRANIEYAKTGNI